MPLPLLQTKLYIPPPRQHLVARPSLTAKFGGDGMHPLTLIAAPAGFGKTTLVSEWIAQARREREQPVVWLSLDEDDNDPIHFLTYLIAALQTYQSQLGISAGELLNTPQAPPPKAILTLLLNDLGSLTTPLVFVLDDYHLITTPAIHEALIFLVDHLPPTFRLVIISRIDPPLPLARWRVRNQLVEVRADDLRFTSHESATFFNEVMGLTLSAAEIAALETRTEGWIAGLQLAALSLQGRANVSSFIQNFSGSNRHILSYLVEEVLNQRPEGTLDFLLQTSILDQLYAPLCNAVTGRDDAQQLLQKLDQANFFLIALDDEGKCYRYHHLFADVLRTRLHQSQAQAIAHLHQRASLWCEQNDRLPEAIQHALACPDYVRAASLIEQCKITFFFDPILQGMMSRWIVLIPDEVMLRHPRLCVIHAWLLQGQIEVERALGRVQAAEEALQLHPYADPNQTRSVWHEILATRALLLAHSPQMDFAQVISLGEEVLGDAPPERIGLRSMATITLAEPEGYIRIFVDEGEAMRFLIFDPSRTSFGLRNGRHRHKTQNGPFTWTKSLLVLVTVVDPFRCAWCNPICLMIWV